MLVVSRLSATWSGHPGVVRAPCLADLCHEVAGIDVPPCKVEQVSNGSSHFDANPSGAFSSALSSMSGLRAIAADILAAVTHRTVRLVSCAQRPNENHHV